MDKLSYEIVVNVLGKSYRICNKKYSGASICDVCDLSGVCDEHAWEGQAPCRRLNLHGDERFVEVK